MSVDYFVARNEEIFSDERKLDIDYIYDNDIKFGPSMIDTLTFSFKYFQDQEIISMCQPFGFDFQPLKDGGQFISQAGYERIYICQRTHSTIKCAWKRLNHSEISVLSITGSGCSLLYSNDNMRKFCLNLFNSVKAFGLFSQNYRGERCFRCTRIDICKDCFTDYFESLASNNYGNLSQMYYSLGRFGLELSPHISFRRGKIQSGWTLYFGKRDNATYIRIYDKRCEQKISDERLPYWSRLEFELKNKDAFLQANNFFLDYVDGASVDDLFKTKCENTFFFLKNQWTGECAPRKDEVLMDPAFKKFISCRWDNSEENLCFAKCLFFHDQKKSDETVKRLVSALAPKVFSNKSIKSIVYNFMELLYPDGKEYRIDNMKKCIYIYYRSNSGNILDDIPCLQVDVPSEYWDDLSYIAKAGNLSLDDILETVKKMNDDFIHKQFIFTNDEVSVL